ncbi:hypothetical protein ACFFWC_18550 [Plantactinospora siamensis]|uniref:Uncharacterized protein n=1 Tax=Plantactinospora siamensis TaxID=555372 RepID=A0ABV6P424_9ACTN
MGDQRRGGPPSTPFWQSLSGVLTAVAALITALVGAAAFLYQVVHGAGTGGHAPAGGVAATPSVSLTAGAQPAASETKPSAAAQGETRGAGPYELLFNNNGVDLDADPPKVATGPDSSIDIYDGGGSIESFPIWSGLAKWDKPGAPSRQACISQLNSFATIGSRYAKGSRYCVHTRGDLHVAYVEFVKADGDGWRIRVTVWPGTAA